MNAPCAHCREAFEELQEQLRQLKVIAFGQPKPLPMEWRLTPCEAVLARLLAIRQRVTFETFASAMSHQRHDYAPDSKLMHVMACKLRGKLGPFGVQIVNHFGQGYSIDEPMRTAFRTAIAEGVSRVGEPVTSHPRRRAA